MARRRFNGLSCLRDVVVGSCLVLALGCSKNTAPPAQPPPERSQPVSATSTVVAGKVSRLAEGSRAILVLEPRTPREFPLPAEPKVMDQQGLTFVPGLLVVRQGQAVLFRNSEDVLHNVRVGETGTAQPVFNVATVPGNSYMYKFDRAGFYSVSCDVHETMHADIFVTPAPYAVVADETGSFTFPDVASGPYTLAVYSGGRRIEQSVDVTGPKTEVSVKGE